MLRCVKKPFANTRPRLGSTRWLEAQLDDLTSKIIRHHEQICFNIGCTETQGLQCGHLLERRHRAIRWDISADGNCHSQCSKHNQEHERDGSLYRESFIKRFGQAAHDELEYRSRSKEKITPIELEAKYLEYKELWNQLRKAA